MIDHVHRTAASLGKMREKLSQEREKEKEMERRARDKSNRRRAEILKEKMKYAELAQQQLDAAAVLKDSVTIQPATQESRINVRILTSLQS